MSAPADSGSAAPCVGAIRRLNDAFRRSLCGGEVVLTAGVRALPPDIVAEIIAQVRTFAAFDPADDPHGEYDFGSLAVGGERVRAEDVE